MKTVHLQEKHDKQHHVLIYIYAQVLHSSLHTSADVFWIWKNLLFVISQPMVNLFRGAVSQSHDLALETIKTIRLCQVFAPVHIFYSFKIFNFVLLNIIKLFASKLMKHHRQL